MTNRIVGGPRIQATTASQIESGAARVRACWNSFRERSLGERNGTLLACFFSAKSVINGGPLYTATHPITDNDALLGLGETPSEYLSPRPDHSDRASLVRPGFPTARHSQGGYR